MTILTDPQMAMLMDVACRAHTVVGVTELFAPNMAVVNALERRGLITARLIGMRWWRLAITEAGQAICMGGIYGTSSSCDRQGEA